VLFRTIDRHSLQDSILASSGLMAVSVILLLVCPYHGPMIAVTAALYAAVAALAVHDSTIGLRWLAVHTLVLSAFTATSYYSIAKARALAATEYRRLRQAAPAQIVRAAVDPGDSLDDRFRPALRPVACVSSDWRDYQRYSQAKGPVSVARTLNAYYDLCEEILQSLAPEGNYYTDWIADELFVVFFGNGPGSMERITQQAYEFSRRLILAKGRFLEEHDMPQGIDLGISTGEALVGMMGPTGHRKATALGEIPGRSRRLQTAGKLLRMHLGECDRILVDGKAESLLDAPAKAGLRTFALDRPVRDMDGHELRYAEPVAGDDAPAVAPLRDRVA
jgi:class 3 adenylate cyclase